jgi:hypothetical protein
LRGDIDDVPNVRHVTIWDHAFTYEQSLFIGDIFREFCLRDSQTALRPTLKQVYRYRAFLRFIQQNQEFHVYGVSVIAFEGVKHVSHELRKGGPAQQSIESEHDLGGIKPNGNPHEVLEVVLGVSLSDIAQGRCGLTQGVLDWEGAELVLFEVDQVDVVLRVLADLSRLDKWA